jgi:hypothetical protein
MNTHERATMQSKNLLYVQIVLMFLTIAAVCGATAGAQPVPAKKPSPPKFVAQTDAAFSFYRTFTGSTSGHDTAQTPSNGIGGMFELRHLQSRWIGYEIAYGVNPADQSYKPDPGKCGYLCGNQPVNISAMAHQVSIDWVPSFKYRNIDPFAIGGAGFYINVPTSALSNLGDVVRPMFVYGGGFDWNFLPNAGLRIQYRGNLYKAPDLDNYYNATGAYTQTGEPMVGVYFGL